MSVTRWSSVAGAMALVALMTVPAAAQYEAPRVSDPATGEKYHFELAGELWMPTPELTISSEGLGIPGSDIDFVTDLGIEKQTFPEMRIVVRPARKHKFRVDYLPMKYSTETVLERTIVFNGIAYRIGVPVESEVKWQTWNLLYEWDFVYRDRGFAGVILGARYTNVEASLSNPIDTEFAKARGPIPVIGGIGRAYVVPNISITGQVTFFDMPDEASERFNGDLYDIDIYGTVNFVNNVGAQVGWRSVKVDYLVDQDSGNLRVDGLYFGGVVRF